MSKKQGAEINTFFPVSALTKRWPDLIFSSTSWSCKSQIISNSIWISIRMCRSGYCLSCWKYRSFTVKELNRGKCYERMGRRIFMLSWLLYDLEVIIIHNCSSEGFCHYVLKTIVRAAILKQTFETLKDAERNYWHLKWKDP